MIGPLPATGFEEPVAWFSDRSLGPTIGPEGSLSLSGMSAGGDCDGFSAFWHDSPSVTCLLLWCRSTQQTRALSAARSIIPICSRRPMSIFIALCGPVLGGTFQASVVARFSEFAGVRGVCRFESGASGDCPDTRNQRVHRSEGSDRRSC